MPTHVRHGLTLIVASVLALLVVLDRPTAEAFPEPAIVNRSWALDFEFQAPKAIAVPDLEGVVRWYWYLPYKVTNNTGEDKLYVPEFVVYEDNGRIIRASKDVPSNVFPAIKQYLRNPLLKSPVEIVGKLLKGDDFAKESVAIWPAATKDVDSFSIFVGGLYGETQTDTNPRTGKEILLRRTLMLRYEMPGDFPTPQNQPVTLIEKTDVMR